MFSKVISFKKKRNFQSTFSRVVGMNLRCRALMYFMDQSHTAFLSFVPLNITFKNLSLALPEWMRALSPYPINQMTESVRSEITSFIFPHSNVPVNEQYPNTLDSPSLYF